MGFQVRRRVSPLMDLSKRPTAAAASTRPGGRGDHIDLIERHIRVRQRRFDQWRQGFHMGAGGDFRHDAAIGAVRLFLRGQPMRQYSAVGRHQCRCGFIAARFQAKDDCHCRFHLMPAPIRASRI